MSEALETRPASIPTELAVIDCDLHAKVPSINALLPHLSEHWREYVAQSAFKGPPDTSYPPAAPTSTRPDRRGRPPVPGSTVAEASAMLDGWGVSHGILNCAYAVDGIHNPDAALAVSRAANDWLVAEWLEKDPRLRASLVVPNLQPEMGGRGDRPSGRSPRASCRCSGRSTRRCRTHTESTTRSSPRPNGHALAVGLHFGGRPGNAPTSSVALALRRGVRGHGDPFPDAAHEPDREGVFDRSRRCGSPWSKSGFAWLARLPLRFDKEWRDLRGDPGTPSSFPLSTCASAVRITLQPIDGPADAGRASGASPSVRLSRTVLMFSTTTRTGSTTRRRRRCPLDFPSKRSTRSWRRTARPSTASRQEEIHAIAPTKEQSGASASGPR